MARRSPETSARSVAPSPTPILLTDSAGQLTSRLLPHFDTVISIRKPLAAMIILCIYTYLHHGMKCRFCQYARIYFCVGEGAKDGGGSRLRGDTASTNAREMDDLSVFAR